MYELVHIILFFVKISLNIYIIVLQAVDVTLQPKKLQMYIHNSGTFAVHEFCCFIQGNRMGPHVSLCN